MKSMLSRIDKLVQPCFVCSKALGGCSWSSKFEPVDGWVANKVFLRTNLGKQDSFRISYCPEFDYDGQCCRCIHREDNIENMAKFSDGCKLYFGHGKTGCASFEREGFVYEDSEKEEYTQDSD